MQPKDVLVLLDIVEKSSKSPAYAHITGAAHDALLAAQLVAMKMEEEKSSPPSKKGEK